MRETKAIIERVRRVTSGLQQIDLSVDSSLAHLRPGQSLFAYPVDNDTWSPYLREQWFPVAAHPGGVTVEIPLAQQTYRPSQIISLLAPVGRPIPLVEGGRALLLIVQDTPPTPLVWLAHQRLAGGGAVTLVLSGQALDYPLELLPPEIEVLRGDTQWRWPEQDETLTWADQVIALAAPYLQAEAYGGLMRTIQQLRSYAVPDGFVSGMYLPRLACATGACLACQVPTRHRDVLACIDGPAVDLKQVVF